MDLSFEGECMMKGCVVFFLIICGACVTSTTSPSDSSDQKSQDFQGGVPGSFSEGLVSFNFDDNRLCAYNSAIPVLDSLGFKSTNYVITGRLGDPSDYMSSRDVLSLQMRGHEIGSHTRTHRDMTTLSRNEWHSEIVESREILNAMGVRQVVSFAYPFGAHNEDLKNLVRNSGYSGARSTIGGPVITTTDKFALRRQNLGSGVTISEVKKWINEAKQDKTWLILLAHHTDNSPSEYSITPELFREIAEYVASSKIKVVTISEGLRMM